ncbi:DUF6383 domain-containing protein [uncultured Parabacteroides sp.]|uniref:DUF6383 domain-containing protein n=1 Tax=uncultured Parabacteroides sp. TaxID=512312 RepID=UPI00261E8195|nr:DUF6383 domain-containing protein [uncultured Parabacteroides sp.]
MKRKLHFLLAVGIGLTASVGWLHAETATGGKLHSSSSAMTFKTGAKDTLFANGNPIRIELQKGSTTELDSIKVSVLNAAKDGTTADYFTCKNDAKLVVIGGKCSAEAETSYIEMISGKLSDIFGGGFGYGTTTAGTIAKVGTATLKISGGEITNKILGSGGMYSFTDSVYMEISGTAKVSGYAFAGPFANAGRCGNTSATTYESSNCKTRTAYFKTGKVEINNLAIGGGESYSHLKNVRAELNGTKIHEFSAAGSNGWSDSINIVATGCIFEKGDIQESTSGQGDNNASVISGTVRTRIESLLNVTFDNCTFPADANQHYSLGAVDAWGTSGSNEASAPYLKGKVNYTFKGDNLPVFNVGFGLDDADLTVTGAKVKIAAAQRGNSTKDSTFTIAAAKTWTFNNGLSIEKGATLTKTGTLVYAGSLEANVSTADELKAAVAVEADIVNLADTTYVISDSLLIKKSIALQGTDTAKCIVKGKWVITPSDMVDVTLSSLKLTESATAADSAAIINIDQPKVHLTLDNVKVDMQTVGHRKGDLYKGEHAAIKIAPTVTSSTVELNNSKIQLGANNQVGFYNEGGSCNFIMEGSEISVIQGKALTGVNAILAIGAAGATYNINNATLSVGDNYYYAIWIKSPEQHFVINNSQVYGWAAFYMQGAWYSADGADGMTLKASHSTFAGVGKEGSSNGFGVIVFEGTERSVVEMDNCTITSKIIDNTKDYGFVPPIVFQKGGGTGGTKRPCMKPSADCSVSLKNCTLQNMAEATTSVFVSYENVLEKESNGYLDYNRNIVSIDPSTRFLNADGSKSILIRNGDTLRNATKTLPNALIQFSKSYGDNNEIVSSYKKPVAYPGDTVMVTDISMVLAVKSLNDSVPTLFAAPTTGGLKYITAPDSIVINCKDGYLVTGEETAKAFAANTNPDKLVFWLKQDTSATNNDVMFTKVAVGNQRLTIAGSVTINDANKARYNNRTIALAKDADLTVNVPLVLDSVIFLTDAARLTTTQNVTANVLQLNYLVKAGKWTAFGFPKGGTTGDLIVKKSGADEALKFAAEDAADGIWQANVSLATGGLLPQIKVKETNPQVLDSACLIATSGHDSLIVVTSPEQQTVSLSTKPEIGQPVLTKAEAQAAFSFVANPNTHPITLNKTAYVLNPEGTKFERTDGAEIPAFGSYILADAGTTSTLRSLKIGDTPTGNEVIAVEGYFVRTGKGTIIIHTAEPVQVTVVDMLGRVYFNARVASDGYQISVPAGIYAVNRQKVIVK